MRNFKGTKYDSKLDVAEIAKRLRTEIREAVKTGVLPKLKCSVRIDRYSMGQSIDVTVTEYDGPVLNPNYDRMSALEDNRHEYLPEIRAAVAKIQAMMDAYNYDNSDTMTDYFDVNFYGHAQVSWKLRGREAA